MLKPCKRRNPHESSLTSVRFRSATVRETRSCNQRRELMEIADDAHGQSFSAARSRFSKMRRKPLRFTSFGIMNLVVGVIVENTLSAGLAFPPPNFLGSIMRASLRDAFFQLIILEADWSLFRSISELCILHTFIRISSRIS